MVQRELEFSRFELGYSDGGKFDEKETKKLHAPGKSNNFVENIKLLAQQVRS